MAHNYSCPHNCASCKLPKSRLKAQAWKDGQCIVCGNSRDGNAYSCDECWGYAGIQNEITKWIEGGKKVAQ